MAQRRHRSDWEDRLRAVRTEKGRPDFGPGRPSQIVVKVVGWTKSARGVRSMLEYIAGVNEDHDSELRTAEGELIDPEEIRAELDGWGLLDNQDNLSPEAKKLSAAERAGMPEKERLKERQAAHLVISLPPGQVANKRQMEVIAERWLEPLQGDGFQAAYAIHQHQAQQHIHIVIKARALDGKRLVLNPQQLDDLRVNAAHIANSVGLKVRADRRVHENKLYQKILKGEADLRPKHDHKNATQAKAEAEQKQTNLSKQSPLWHSHFGAEYYARREAAARDAGDAEIRKLATTPKEREMLRRPTADAAAELRQRANNISHNASYADDGSAAAREYAQAARLEKLAAEIERRVKAPDAKAPAAAEPLKTAAEILQSPPKLPARSEAAIQKWAGQFEKPDEARRSFVYMAAENSRTAFWYANNRPEIFGAVKPDAATEKISQRQVAFGPTKEAAEKYRETLKLKLSITNPAVDNKTLAESQKRASIAQEVNRLENALIRLEKDLPRAPVPTKIDQLRDRLAETIGRKADPQKQAFERLQKIASGAEQPRQGDAALIRQITPDQLARLNEKIRLAQFSASEAAPKVATQTNAAQMKQTPEGQKPMSDIKVTPIITEAPKATEATTVKLPPSPATPQIPNYRPTQAAPHFERDIPRWFATHGNDFRLRQARSFSEIDNRRAHADLPKLSPAAEQKIEAWAVQFKNPDAARASFKLMMAENRRAAEWFANHRPEIFGNRKDNAQAPKIEADRLRFTNSKEHGAWRNKTLDTAEKPTHKITQSPKHRR